MNTAIPKCFFIPKTVDIKDMSMGTFVDLDPTPEKKEFLSPIAKTNKLDGSPPTTIPGDPTIVEGDNNQQEENEEAEEEMEDGEMEEEEMEEEEHIEPPEPPAQLSQGAIYKRLRRIMKAKCDGSWKVPKEVVEEYNDPKRREKLESIFEKLAYDAKAFISRIRYIYEEIDEEELEAQFEFLSESDMKEKGWTSPLRLSTETIDFLFLNDLDALQ